METGMEARRALIVAHEADGPGGQVAVRLAQHGYEIDTHVVTPDTDQPNVATPFPSFSDYDLIAVMGSIRSLTRKDEIDSWIEDELTLIREAHIAGQPILGICFGGQLIAEALGGSVELAPTTEIGWHTIEATEEGNPVGAGPWMEWHHDRFTPPPGATVLATTPRAPQLFTIGRTVGTQFHPEVDVAHLKGWLETADEEYLAEYDQNAPDLLADMAANEMRNTEQCHRLVDWFLFRIAAVEAGFGDERVVRYEANATPDFHTHDFDAMVLITEGELQLAFEDRTETLRVGDTCTVPSGTSHSEQTGPTPAASLLFTR